MNYKKRELPYKYNELEPYIDELTVKTHYEEHFQSYINNFNKFISGYDEFTEGKSIEDILKEATSLPQNIRAQVINNGGGIINHNFYFDILTPNGKGNPERELLKKIEATFSSFNNMKQAVSRAAIEKFGAGWSFLVLNDKKELEIISTSNQDTPILRGLKPLLAIDVWEHAYYLKYKSSRVEYVKNIWSLFDWDKINEIYNRVC